MGLPRLALFCPGSSTSQGSIEPAAGCLSRPRDANETVMIYTQIKHDLLVAVCLTLMSGWPPTLRRRRSRAEIRAGAVQLYSDTRTPSARLLHSGLVLCQATGESDHLIYSCLYLAV
jgi:hypothetical protein